MIHNAISIHTHRGALNAFNKEFVRTEIFTVEEGHLFSKLEDLRERGGTIIALLMQQKKRLFRLLSL